MCSIVRGMYTSMHVQLGLFCDLIRLASGDTEGRVVVWDVASGGVTVALDDALTVSSGWQHGKPAAVVCSYEEAAAADASSYNSSEHGCAQHAM
jgi:hypothetical protein